MDNFPEGTSGFISRRGFVEVLTTSAAGMLLAGCSATRRALGFWPPAKAQTPFITPNEDFFIVAVDPSYRPPVDPRTVAAGWALEVAGLGGTRGQLGYDDLSSRAGRRVPYTFECIGNPVGGQLIGNALWDVVPLREILVQAPGGTQGARAVMFEGMDGFYSSVSLERAMDDYAFIALRMNGVPLPAEHGFPARVILPDLYGKKQPRWLKRIALLEDSRTTSYWEKRGWAGEVPVKTMSRLDPRERISAGRPAEFTGVAFAGRRGIRQVEISLDDGRSWVPCQLVTGPMPNVWSLWRYEWRNPTPGRHSLRIRATDGSGSVQTARRQGRFPDGASGHHRLVVSATR